MKKTIQNTLNIIAFLIDTNHTNTQKGNWKKYWFHLMEQQSKLTKIFVLISHKKCHANSQNLLRNTVERRWLQFKKKHDHCVYILLNWLSGAAYIGRTNDKKRRMQEHLRYAYKISDIKQSTGKEYNKLYKFISNHHPYHWSLVPLVYCHAKAAPSIEKRFIKQYPRASCLNTVHKRQYKIPKSRAIKALRKQQKTQPTLVSTVKLNKREQIRYKSNTTLYTHKNETTPFLYSIFQKLHRNKIYKPSNKFIFIEPGFHQVSNYTSLKRRFGKENHT